MGYQLLERLALEPLPLVVLEYLPPFGLELDLHHFVSTMIGLTLNSGNTFLGIVILQSFVVFFPTFLFILLMQQKKLFLFGAPEPLTMFAMVVKARVVNSFIFMNVFSLTFMLGFL